MKTSKNLSKHELDNRSNQLNPNNNAYEKSRLNGPNDDDDDNMLEETYADDWEFNHD